MTLISKPSLLDAISNKLDIKVPSITFMGHLISTTGIHPDPKKVTALTEMESPNDVPSLRRFLGMVNYLQKFLPQLTSVLHPLHHQLVKKDIPLNWPTVQEKAFTKIKEMITKAPILTYYNPHAPLELEIDACEYGLGSVLLQQ